jgi:hypothetical protein
MQIYPINEGFILLWKKCTCIYLRMMLNIALTLMYPILIIHNLTTRRMQWISSDFPSEEGVWIANIRRHMAEEQVLATWALRRWIWLQIRLRSPREQLSLSQCSGFPISVYSSLTTATSRLSTQLLRLLNSISAGTLEAIWGLIVTEIQQDIFQVLVGNCVIVLSVFFVIYTR